MLIEVLMEHCPPWKAHLILSEVEGSGPGLTPSQFFHTL